MMIRGSRHGNLFRICISMPYIRVVSHNQVQIRAMELLGSQKYPMLYSSLSIRHFILLNLRIVLDSGFVAQAKDGTLKVHGVEAWREMNKMGGYKDKRLALYTGLLRAVPNL